MLSTYLPVLLQVLVVIGFAAMVLILSVVFGRSAKRNATKDIPYECGMLPVGEGAPRFSVKFYLVAMLFVIFDIEVVFFLGWAAVFRQLLGEIGYRMLAGGAVFLLILEVGQIYCWKKGALDWTPKKVRHE